MTLETFETFNYGFSNKLFQNRLAAAFRSDAILELEGFSFLPKFVLFSSNQTQNSKLCHFLAVFMFTGITLHQTSNSAECSVTQYYSVHV